MKIAIDTILIPLDNIEPQLELHIYGKRNKTLYSIDNHTAIENGESTIQILEGASYNYYFKVHFYYFSPVTSE